MSLERRLRALERWVARHFPSTAPTLRRMHHTAGSVRRSVLTATAAHNASGSSHQRLANSVWDDRYRNADETGQLANADCDPIDFTRHPFIYRHAISAPLTGSPDGYWLDRIGRTYLTPPAGLVLSLGCGTAIHDEHLLSRGHAERIIAYDASAEAIRAARTRFDATPFGARIDLRCGDPLHDPFEPASIDVVFVEAAIHHFIQIDEMYRFMHRVLKPNGLLIFDEYVGPDHHQHPPELLAILDRINACLAEEYRRDFEFDAPRERVDPTPLDWMLAYDPTEGVHASRILPLTYQYFDVVERCDYGSAVLRPFFSRILTNWNFEDSKDQTIARLIILLDHELTRHGIVPTHQTLVVARPRREPLPPLSAEEIERIGYTDWGGLGPAGSSTTAPTGRPKFGRGA